MKKNSCYMGGDGAIDPNEKILYLESGKDTSVHRHAFLEIIYFKSGVGTHNINGKDFTITRGNICILNTDINHYYEIKPNSDNKEIEVKNIIFYSSFLDEKYSSNNFIDEVYEDLMHTPPTEHNDYIQLSQDYNKDFLALFSLIEHELASKEKGYLDVVRNILYSVLIKIFRHDSKQKEKSPLLLKNIEIVEKALELIEKRYHETLTLHDVSNYFNYSMVYFNTLFQRHTGCTFKKYLQNLRCEKAKKLLKETDLTILEISEQVGYSDVKHFFGLFKSIVGLTPNTYRKKNREKTTPFTNEKKE